jgi:glutathione peroxidase
MRAAPRSPTGVARYALLVVAFVAIGFFAAVFPWTTAHLAADGAHDSAMRVQTTVPPGLEQDDNECQIYDAALTVDSGDGDGHQVNFAKHAGTVTLFVNVASHCGFTTAGYTALVELWRAYHEQVRFTRAFHVVALPSNDFGGQEPGGIESIRRFAAERFNATFPILGKVHAASRPGMTPLIERLARCSPGSAKNVNWNWNFFLVNARGHVAGRFPPGTPSRAMAPLIEALLAA